MAVTVVGAGAGSAWTWAGGINFVWPAGHQTGDIMIVFPVMRGNVDPTGNSWATFFRNFNGILLDEADGASGSDDVHMGIAYAVAGSNAAPAVFADDDAGASGNNASYTWIVLRGADTPTLLNSNIRQSGTAISLAGGVVAATDLVLWAIGTSYDSTADQLSGATVTNGSNLVQRTFEGTTDGTGSQAYLYSTDAIGASIGPFSATSAIDDGWGMGAVRVPQSGTSGNFNGTSQTTLPPVIVTGTGVSEAGSGGGGGQDDTITDGTVINDGDRIYTDGQQSNFNGSGATVLPDPVVAGTGASGRSGTAAHSLTAPSAQGQGVSDRTGAGSTILLDALISGAGEVGTAGSGTTVLPPVVGMGTSSTNDASGATVLDDPIVSGTGETATSGVSAHTLAPIVASGAGETGTAGSGATVLPPVVGIGAAENNTGVAQVVLPPVNTAGVGVSAVDGTAAVVLTAPAGSGAGIYVDISAGPSLPPPDIPDGRRARTQAIGSRTARTQATGSRTATTIRMGTRATKVGLS